MQLCWPRFFPSDVEKIARLGHGLATNHAFLDGNKRIGAMMVQLLLKWNGYQLELVFENWPDMFIALADDRATERGAARLDPHT